MDGADDMVGTLDDDLRLSTGSPCIDAGDNRVVTESRDLDGNLRIINCNVDMGPYEDQTVTLFVVQNITQNAFHCAIQEAIDAALEGDEIVVPPGTYHETIDLLGKAITVRSSGGAAATTIDATNAIAPGDSMPVVRCVNGETASTVLDGFTITGGTGDTSLFGTECPVGGGMFNSGTSPTVRNCTFAGNSAHSGGGMYNDLSNTTVTKCTFGENTATTKGGGMYNDNSNPSVTNGIFSGNTATEFGGGMYNIGSSESAVTNCVFTGNTANRGGGMVNANSDPNSDNHPTVSNCTFSGNTATEFGGWMFNSFATGGPTVTNCILWGNSDAGGMDESAQIFVLDGAPTVNYSDVQGGWTGAGGTGNINEDPLFADADGADDIVGTVDDDVRLSPGSPCIDSAATFGYGAGPPLDLDGNTRAVDDPSTPNTGVGMLTFLDMGAYEFPTAPGVIDGDFDNDGDVDLDDFALFMLLFTGPF